jgi:hypothetical protein
MRQKFSRRDKTNLQMESQSKTINSNNIAAQLVLDATQYAKI